MKPALELLSSLRQDLPRVAVLGNHDHVYGSVTGTTSQGVEVAGDPDAEERRHKAQSSLG